MKTLSGKTAVVGLSGILPGAGDGNLNRFCRNIMEKRSAVIEVPPDRWALPQESVLSSRYRPDTASSNRAGIVRGFSFDPTGFEMHPDLLLQLDPLHHMVLHAGRDALMQCAHSRELLAKTGVVLAAIALPTNTSSDLAWKIIMESGGIGSNNGMGRNGTTTSICAIDALAAGMVSIPAAILAKGLGLQGGAFTLDAACASSLFAIKIACEQLQSGKTDMMIAGGVSRPDSLYTQIGFTQLKALSPSGRCAPFDKTADGLVVGEGAGLVVLKRLEDAVRSGDTIYGVISGYGWSNDIEGNLVAPASEGQIRSMEAAYQSAGWSPGDVQHIECHGSATPVGDTIELNSMATLWRKAGLGDGGCAIGSIKSMTGHLLTAAGAAGFIKTLLAMNEKMLPPSLNFTCPTEDSPLNTTDFHVQTEAEPWEPKPLAAHIGHGTSQSSSRRPSSTVARRAGISAFGFGGINAHILVEDYSTSHFAISVPQRIDSHSGSDSTNSEPAKSEHRQIPIAVIGMECITPTTPDLTAFAQKILDGSPHAEFGSLGFSKNASKSEVASLWFDELITHPGEFHIPPNQIKDILPQHLLMLKAAMGAIRDAGIAPRSKKDAPGRTAFGAAIGIEFDYGATDFHLKWRHSHEEFTGPQENLQKMRQTDRADDQTTLKADQIADSILPLTNNRTLGALGGIVASRIAREFKLGGPCFTLSAGADSGMTAVEIAIASLQSGETDTFLCGCVDMAGDIRQHSLNRSLHADSNENEMENEMTFDHRPFPSEGAGAIVLKPLDLARKNGDRIYAVIKGHGSASDGSFSIDKKNRKNWEKGVSTYSASLTAALEASNYRGSDIMTVHGHGGDRYGSAIERDALFRHGLDAVPFESTASIVGDTHGASGMLSMIHAAYDIHRWKVDSIKGDSNVKAQHPSCVGSMTPYGTSSHVVLDTSGVDISATEMESSSTFLKQTINIEAPTGTEISITAHKFNYLPFPSILEYLSFSTVSGEYFLSPENKLSTPDGFSKMDPFPLTGDLQGIDTLPLPIPDPSQESNLFTSLEKCHSTTAEAHMKFLEFSQNNVRELEKQYHTLTTLASTAIESGQAPSFPQLDDNGPIGIGNGTTTSISPLIMEEEGCGEREQRPTPDHTLTASPRSPILDKPLFDKEMCMEFAVGLAGNVLGEPFKVIDTYPVRVRFPDAPLMLVDRIMAVEGKMLSLTSGKVVTHHDVKPNAWYLDGGKTPVAISIEAGQADLFLCSYLGIDHVVKGTRRYRLLDAKVTFHRTLPEPGETIEYHIEIDRFLKQGDVYLFFFHYKGYIGKELLISMRDGCAGFFTLDEVKNSGGIILKQEDLKKETRERGFHPPEAIVQVLQPENPASPAPPPPPGVSEDQERGTGKTSNQTENYNDSQVDALRRGDLEKAFGNAFSGITLGRHMRLPGGRMHLIDRVLELDPTGGRFGLGFICAEADIHPDDWFLTCHFVDDMVMPGTLMYECCAHALRIFTQRMGWISSRNDCRYDIIPGIESDLKCRGPVTRETKKARYEIEVKEMGFGPEPYVIADAHMFSDNHRIVLYKNMGMKIEGLSHNEINTIWDSGESVL